MITFCREAHLAIDFVWRAVIWGILLILPFAVLASCAGKSTLPPSAPPAVEVLVPVTQPCEVEQVQTSQLHTDNGSPADLYDATKELLADLKLLKADREKLVAANTDPCPAVKL